jgi:hypothetical protein
MNPSRALHSADWLVLLPCALAAVLLGKDLNWDFLNYHLYAGLAASGARIGADVLPASIQSYLVPYAYVPIYWMTAWAWPSWLVCAVLGALHGINLVLVLAIARLLPLPEDPKLRRFALLMAVALAAVTPIFILELGTSFIDISTSVPVLAGVLLFLLAVPALRPTTLGLAGALIGVAVALKLTNAVFALALLPALAIAARLRWRPYLAAGTGLGVGFVLTGGVWFHRVWAEFGNPFFPFFNSIFRSPDYPPVSFKHLRFLPEGFGEALARIFEIALPVRQVYIESAAPDLRLAAVVVLLAAAVLALPFLNRSDASGGADTPPAELLKRQRLMLLSIFWVVALAAWLATSGNGRYFLAALLLAGPLLAALLFVVLGRSRRAFVYGSLALLGLQTYQTLEASDLRWAPGNPSGPWLEIEVPDHLRERPYTYVSMSSQSNSFLAAFVHPQSSFAAVWGQFSIAPGTPSYDRVVRLLADSERQAVIVIPIDVRRRDNLPHRPSSLEGVQRSLRAFRMRIDEDRCGFIKSSDPFASLYWVGDRSEVQPYQEYDGYIFYCHLVRDETLVPEEPPAAVIAALDTVERSCPRIFAPALPATIRAGARWMRTYANSDTTLYAVGDRVYHIGWRMGEPIFAGTVEDLAAGKVGIDCRQRFAPVEFPNMPFAGIR